jgi:hypothetical protein
MLFRSLLAFAALALAFSSAEDSLSAPDALSSCKTYQSINGLTTCFSCPQDGCSVNFSGVGLTNVTCSCSCSGDKVPCLSRAATAEEIKAIDTEEGEYEYEYDYDTYEYEYDYDDRK